MAGGLGFEPRLAESESAVLPLDDPPPVDETGRAKLPGRARSAATRQRELTLRVLRAAASLAAPDLLALDLTGVAGDEAGLAERSAQR